jgi:hypothetical protein
MTPATIEDRAGLLTDVLEQVRGCAQWRATIDRALDRTQPQQAHVAVMHEPFLSYVLDGRKRVESRFSRTRVAPYGQVRAGDLLLLKELGGPISGLAEVTHADSYVLDPTVWTMLHDRFASALCADEAFWEQRRDARFATLMSLGAVTPMEPVPVDKHDRRGWVVLVSEPQIHRDQMALIDHDDRHLRQTHHRLVYHHASSPIGSGQLRLI